MSDSSSSATDHVDRSWSNVFSFGAYWNACAIIYSKDRVDQLVALYEEAWKVLREDLSAHAKLARFLKLT